MQKDGWKVIVGIVIFLGFFTFPIWFPPLRDLVLPAPAEASEGGVYAYVHELMAGSNMGRPVRSDTEECLLTAEEKDAHMQVLDGWRNEVVREGQRFLDSDRRRGDLDRKSLTWTCLSSGCHRRDSVNESARGTRVPPCAECHQFVGVEGGHQHLGDGGELFDEVFCWDCHVASTGSAGRSNDDEQ